jgi:hypothetical protein
VVTATREEIRGVSVAAKMQLAKLSFPRFLNYVQIRSDDPLNPVIMPWQPWPYLIEQAESWAAGTSEIDLKDRQLGYSWLVAAYAVWRARNGALVALISKGQLEARELAAKCAFVEQHLPEWLRVKATIRVDDISFAGDGKIMAFPSTPDAGVSFTFQLVIMDEAHFHPYAAQNFAAIQPTISAGGQFIALSTADPSLGPHGWFPTMYWASKAGRTGYTSRFVPWHVRPGRDRAWLERQRATYEGMAEEFDAFYADTDAQAFAGRSGLVYPDWNEALHVRPERVPIEQCRRRVAGLDLGGGDPTAVVVLGLDGDHHVHQYAEFYKRGLVSIEEYGGWLTRYKVDTVACPPEQSTVIATLRSQFKLNAVPADNSRKDGFTMVETLIKNNRLTIEPDCKESIAEFPGYRWANKTDPNDKTRYATKTPVDHHADAHDARRYAVMEITAMLRNVLRLPTRSLSGRPLARRAV